MIKILLLENNLGDAYLIQNQLNAEIDLQSQIHFNLVHVRYLREAIVFLKEEYFDLILLEPVLPDRSEINPLSAFLTIRDEFLSIPIVVITGLEDREVMSQARNNGVHHYILKKDLPTKVLTSLFFDVSFNVRQ